MIHKTLKVVFCYVSVFSFLIINLLVLTKGYLPTRSAYSYGMRVSYTVSEAIEPIDRNSRVLGASIMGADGTRILVEDFIRRYQPKSPLLPHVDTIIESARKYDIDYTLVPAIAMCESNLGLRIPKNSHNAWGIAVYTGQQDGKHFQDWPAAIDWVSKYIRTKFYDRQIYDLNQMSAIWAPPSVEKDFSWATCVQRFKLEMQ